MTRGFPCRLTNILHARAEITSKPSTEKIPSRETCVLLSISPTAHLDSWLHFGSCSGRSVWLSPSQCCRREQPEHPLAHRDFSRFRQRRSFPCLFLRIISYDSSQRLFFVKSLQHETVPHRLETYRLSPMFLRPFLQIAVADSLPDVFHPCPLFQQVSTFIASSSRDHNSHSLALPPSSLSLLCYRLAESMSLSAYCSRSIAPERAQEWFFCSTSSINLCFVSNEY